MRAIGRLTTWIIDSGLHAETPSSDAKYLRFLNASMLVFTFAQLPVLVVLIRFKLWTQLTVNFTALALFALGFVLNRNRWHLSAKVLVISVVTVNTAYFAIIMGASAPTHLWLIPMAVLGILVFKPAERLYMATLVGAAMVGFFVLEFVHVDLAPVVRHFETPQAAKSAAHWSTVFAILLTLLLVMMMHRRFADVEVSLSHQKAQSDRLLRAILPEKIATELSETGRTQAVRHDNVSILFADIVGFTPLAASMSAEEVVALLASVFERFDVLIAECEVEKIKTIGDAYMVASGVPDSVPDHAERLARCALGMLDVVQTFSTESGHELQLRIGLHLGPVVAGVIGRSKFAYDLWGESVNLASRLESSGEPGRIQVSDAFRSALDESMVFEARGNVMLKGVGLTKTHWLIKPMATVESS